MTALDRAAAAGAVRPGLPVYITEMGIQSVPKFGYGVSLQQQAEFIAISEKLAWSNPRVVSFDQYLLRDDPPTSSHNPLLRWPGFETGLETTAGKRKPAYDGFRLPLVADAHGDAASPSGGSCVRSAPSGHGSAAVGSTGATGADRVRAGVEQPRRRARSCSSTPPTAGTAGTR